MGWDGRIRGRHVEEESRNMEQVEHVGVDDAAPAAAAHRAEGTAAAEAGRAPRIQHLLHVPLRYTPPPSPAVTRPHSHSHSLFFA